MALETNQRGYDVVSALNERISVKTITTSTHASFNPATLDSVDRVTILRVNVDEEKGISVEELYDAPIEAAQSILRESGGRLTYSIAQGAPREQRPVEQLRVTARAGYSDFEIVRYESGAIRILRDGVVQPVVVKDLLRPIAAEVGVEILTPKAMSRTHKPWAPRSSAH